MDQPGLWALRAPRKVRKTAEKEEKVGKSAEKEGKLPTINDNDGRHCTVMYIS